MFHRDKQIRNFSFLYILLLMHIWLCGNESICNSGEAGSIPGSEKSPGKENGNPLQYSCLENSMDRGA